MNMRIVLHIWRQRNRTAQGQMVRYELPNVSEHMSFLEMLDVLNEELTRKGEDPVTFEHDCREGICGCCGFMINGVPHGPQRGTTVCQLHMRHFRDGDELWLEPFRAAAFPVVKDLMVDRSSMDRVIAAGGYVSVNTGSAVFGHGDGRGVVHWVRSVRGVVPERVGVVVHGGEDFASGAAAAGPSGAGQAGDPDGGADAGRGLRVLHERGRVRGRVSEGDHAGQHRAHEPRLPEGGDLVSGRDGRGGRGLIGARTALLELKRTGLRACPFFD
jgi:hypothetical protein